MYTLVDYLDGLPLNEREKIVLAALYERGPIAVSRLSLIAKTERTLTYKIVKELERKNYAHAIKTGKGLVYKARDIASVVFEHERGLQRLRSAEKYIEQRRNKKQEATDLMVFEGDEGLRNALYYGMEQAYNEEMLGIYGGTYEKHFIDLLNERHLFFKEHRVRSKIIMPNNFEATADFMARAKKNGYAIECRVVRPLSKSTPLGLLRVSVEMFQHNMKIYSFEQKRAIVITDSQAVDLERLIFSMLWDTAEEVV